MEGDEVQRVERRLVDLGYMDAGSDEHFDAYAVRSARAFAEAAGLESNALGKAFIDALFSDDAPKADSFVPHDIASGDRGLAVRAVQEALVRGGLTVSMPDGIYGDDMQQAVARLYEYLSGLSNPKAPLFADPAALSLEAQQALEDGLLGYVRTVQAGDGSQTEGNAGGDQEASRVQRRLHTLYFLPRYGIDGKFGEASVEALRLFQETNAL